MCERNTCGTTCSNASAYACGRQGINKHIACGKHARQTTSRQTPCFILVWRDVLFARLTRAHVVVRRVVSRTRINGFSRTCFRTRFARTDPRQMPRAHMFSNEARTDFWARVTCSQRRTSKARFHVLSLRLCSRSMSAICLSCEAKSN